MCSFNYIYVPRFLVYIEGLSLHLHITSLNSLRFVSHSGFIPCSCLETSKGQYSGKASVSSDVSRYNQYATCSVHVRLNGVKYMLLLDDSNVNGHGCTGVIILNMHHASGRSSCIITIIYYELRINLHDEVACVLGTVIKMSVISQLYYISFGSLSWTYFHVIEFPITFKFLRIHTACLYSDYI